MRPEKNVWLAAEKIKQSSPQHASVMYGVFRGSFCFLVLYFYLFPAAKSSIYLDSFGAEAQKKAAI